MENNELPLENRLDLDDAYNQMMDEQADIRRLEDRLAKFMTEAAFEEFPALKNMSAEQIREFGNVVSRAAGDFALKAANLAYRVEQEK